MPLPLTAQETDVLRAFFVADWGGGLTITSGYQTTISEHADGSEQRRMLSDKPLRNFSRTIMSTGATDVGLLRSFTSLVSFSRFPMPLETEAMYLSQAVPAGQITLPVFSTLYRRLAVGTLVALAPTNFHAKQQPFHTTTIKALTETSVTLDSPVPFEVFFGSPIMPVAVCEPADSLEGSVVTQTVVELPIEAIEHRGPEGGLPMSSDPGFPTHSDGLRIFDIEPHDEQLAHTVSHSVVSARATVGLALPQVNYGRRSRVEQTVTYRFLSRKSAWRLIQFFDAVKGQGRRFWAPVATNDLSFSGTQATAPWSVEEWPLHPAVMAKNTAGQVRVTEGATPTAVVGGSRITFNSPGGEIVWVKPCFRGRFSTDEMTETWTTDEAMETTLSFIEIIDPPVGNAVDVNNPLSRPGAATSRAFSITPNQGGGLSPVLARIPPPPGDNLAPEIPMCVVGDCSFVIGNPVTISAFSGVNGDSWRGTGTLPFNEFFCGRWEGDFTTTSGRFQQDAPLGFQVNFTINSAGQRQWDFSTINPSSEVQELPEGESPNLQTRESWTLSCSGFEYRSTNSQGQVTNEVIVTVN